MSFLLSFHPFKERVNAPAERSRRRPFVAYLRGFVSKRGAKIPPVSTKTRKSVKFFLPLTLTLTMPLKAGCKDKQGSCLHKKQNAFFLETASKTLSF
jgi:hypothetical protein